MSHTIERALTSQLEKEQKNCHTKYVEGKGYEYLLTKLFFPLSIFSALNHVNVKIP
jgi:hypothetical protein